jgi:Domain of unknown function (DUF4167)
MRHNQKQRMRGRNRNGNKSQNPLSKVYESNGPDVKVRGTANHVADKYLQLARDAQSSGDPISAENYYQHAEHYLRIVAAAQEQYRQINPNYRPEAQDRDEDFDDEDDSQGMQGGGSFEQSSYGLRDPQPYLPADQAPFPQRDQPLPSPPGGQQGRYERRDDRRDERRDDRRPRYERPRNDRYGERQGGREGGERQGGERQGGERFANERTGGERQNPDRGQPDTSPEPAPSRAPEPSLDMLPAFITGGAPVAAAAPTENGDEDAGGERSGFRGRRRRRGPRSEFNGGREGGEPSGDTGPANE